MISPDLPITKLTEDKLNRRTFAQSLAKTISQYSLSSSFTVGLYGEWGSGKTSLVNMILESLTEISNDTVILQFNPWLCSDPRQLITQFFKQMATAIKLKKPSAEKAWELVDQYADIFDTTSLIPGVGPILSAVSKVLVKEASERVEQRSADLQESKNQIIRKLKEEEIKIVVSIDDIDRLSEEEIVAIFQLVKALADFPNTVYILAFDYDVVIHALTKVQHGSGKEYLEKIVQIPFEIPAPNINNIHDALFSKLNSILGNISEERWSKTTWAELFQFGLRKYIKSIRDVVRYTNVFMLKYEFLKEETDPVDLLALTALQVFEPSVYSKLPMYKDTLCGNSYSYSSDRQKKEEKSIKETMSRIISSEKSVTNREAATHILAILFPKTKTATDLPYTFGRNYLHRNFLINNNIAAPECFDRYFSLTLENEAIPTATIHELVFQSTESELDVSIARLYEEGKIVRFLEEIEAYARNEYSFSIPSERAPMLITSLTRNWSSFEVDDRGRFSLPFAWRLLLCVDPLLKIINSKVRFPYMHTLFNDEKVQPSTLALLLNDFEVQLGRFTEESTRKDDAVFSLEEVLTLETVFKNRAVTALDSRIALKQKNGLNFLWMLEQIDPEQAVNKERELVSDDVSLVKIISYCTSLGTLSTKIVTKTRLINRKSIDKFIDVDEGYRRIKNFSTSKQFLTLSQNDQMNAVAFILIVERTPSESAEKDYIAEDIVVRALNQLKANINLASSASSICS